MGVKLPITLREGLRLRVFENRVLRRIFGPEGEEVAGGWRSLHNEELHNLYAAPHFIRVIKSRSTHGRNACKILAGKPEWKRPLVSHRGRQEDNTKMYLREVRWEGVEWIHLAQIKDQWRSPVNMVMKLWIP
jgi:hypothetical protein